ncbi:TIR domain-containing protein [Amycolatopsis sp. WAC 01375]|uniref:TIR domain-containing protein n=1 Tax=Amycolatopsis sp. WAC 01375 TaxID=2203194 RepID=UPI0013159C2D|nr:TIR domain-containing protein [Amycolatopsis sp. WAC 01375]
MKVFLSWSGDHSKQIAAAMRDWLPLLVNEIEPFMSTGIEAGARWQTEISSQLESTDFGIIFVTSENQEKPWLNFEAGALAKAVATSRVIPLAIDLKLADIQNPLGQFQAQMLDKNGIKNILLAINSAAERPLEDAHLVKALEKWWPELKEAVERINNDPSRRAVSPNVRRSDRDLLEEVLSTVRGITRAQRLVAAKLERIPGEQQPGLSTGGGATFGELGSTLYRTLVDDVFGGDGANVILETNLEGSTVVLRVSPPERVYRAIRKLARDVGTTISVRVDSEYFDEIKPG